MTEWIANSDSAWGRGWTKYDSLAKLAGNTGEPSDTEVRFYETTSKGEFEIGPSGLITDGKSVIQTQEVTIPEEHMKQMKELSDALELATEEALVEAQE